MIAVDLGPASLVSAVLSFGAWFVVGAIVLAMAVLALGVVLTVFTHGSTGRVQRPTGLKPDALVGHCPTHGYLTGNEQIDVLGKRNQCVYCLMDEPRT